MTAFSDRIGPAHKPFHEERYFPAKISFDGKEIVLPQVLIQYSLSQDGPLLGRVIGPDELFGKLKGFHSQQGSLKSLGDQHGRIDVYSESAFILQVMGRGVLPGPWSSTVDVVAELGFNELYLDTQLTPSGSPKRHITFFLCGPVDHINGYGTGVSSFDGNVKMDWKPLTLAIPDTPFDLLEISRRWLYDEGRIEQVDDTSNVKMTTSVAVVHLRTSSTEAEIGNDALMASATELADDILLLSSLACGRRVNWFRYDFQTDSMMRRYSRRVEESPRGRTSDFDLIAPRHKMDEFIVEGLLSIRKQKLDGVDLSIPILLHVGATRASSFEQRFMLSFLALDRLQAMYAQQRGGKPSISDPKKRRGFLDCVEARCSEFLDPAEADLVREKIPELSRRSQARLIREMAEDLELGLSEFCPTLVDPVAAIVGVRNRTFHGRAANDAPTEEQLFHAYILTSEIVKSAILAHLGRKRKPSCWLHPAG